MRFDRDRSVAECVEAGREPDSQAAVQEVLARAVRTDSALAGLGPPREAGLEVLHRSPTLTIFAAHWAPRMSLPAHDHRLWALIGLYTGREDNIFWRRGSSRAVEAYGANALFAGDVAALPADAVHSVTNPLPRFTGGLHIYGGDFFATPAANGTPRRSRRSPRTARRSARCSSTRTSACGGRLARRADPTPTPLRRLVDDL